MEKDKIFLMVVLLFSTFKLKNCLKKIMTDAHLIQQSVIKVRMFAVQFRSILSKINLTDSNNIIFIDLV